jgi:hypothetical protein
MRDRHRSVADPPWRGRSAALVAGLLLATLASLASAVEPRGPAKPPPAHPAKDPAGQLIQAKTPPFTEGIFPCTECHKEPGDATRRTLGFHEEIQQVFTHGAEARWCLDCHDRADRDVLHLTSGEGVPFTESYRLCGQCHGDKYRDWRAGVHGKRVGQWNGAKTYLLCVNCHNPHAPAFKGVDEIQVGGKATVSPSLVPLKPMKPPQRPQEARR